MNDAWSIFNKMPSRSVVSWTAMILGHVKCGQGQKALDLFQQMQKEGVVPDSVTFVGVLNACASVVALVEGRDIHEQIIQRGFESDVFVGSGLIDMYVKCGSMDDAWRVFNKMPVRNVVSWTAMLKGYAMHGQGMEALAHFKWMCEEGVEIDGVTFVCLLLACSHAGLVNEGLHAFDSMMNVYRIPPTVDHYACKVDLLGRAGHLDEAEDVIKTMPCEPNAAVWMTLLGACRIYGEVEMGERIAKQLLELDPNMTAGYVVLSNIYAAAGKWDLSEKIQQQRKERG
jgi:pentatricopeptide repeat protein